jgi:3-hydroxyacyl-CoA dehydrogenase
MEGSPKPIIAALTGVCLGGGMELALAAQYRVAEKSLKYGLPEVKIGLIPGAGGTQRLPRLCGVRYALDVIVRGRINCSSYEGLKCGFLDGVASNEETVIDCAMRWARWALKLPPITLESRRLCHRSVPHDADGMQNTDMCDFALQSCPPKEAGGESARAAVEAIRVSFELSSFTEGMEVEKNIFNDLLYHSLQGRAYRHIFFAERSSSGGRRKATTQLAKGKGTVGVIGAGTMGRGISISFLKAGYGPLILVDVNAKGLEAGVKYIQTILQADAKKGRLSPSQLKAALGSLESSTELSSLANCDLVVEAVFENLGLKRDIFSKLDSIVKKKDTLLLSNTSTLDVDAISSSLSPRRRSFCAGMHFFSPAHMMKLVEVVKGKDTSPDTLETIRAVTKRIGKIPVVVGNCDGFVGNRMMHPYTTESTLVLVEHGGGEDGLTVADVDAAIGVKYFGMALGPFEVSDVAGNDIGYNIRREKGLVRDSKTGQVGMKRPRGMRYTEIADEMVEKMGRLGQKVQKGWYNYDPNVGKGRKPLFSMEMQQLLDKYSKNSPFKGTKLQNDEIVQRVLFPLVNEGFKILEEGIASDPSDIDIIYLYGYGWPAWRGGPMFWADNDVGLPVILNKLEQLHKMNPGSEYFRPSALLRECVRKGLGVQQYFRRSKLDAMKSKL